MKKNRIRLVDYSSSSSSPAGESDVEEPQAKQAKISTKSTEEEEEDDNEDEKQSIITIRSTEEEEEEEDDENGGDGKGEEEEAEEEEGEGEEEGKEEVVDEEEEEDAEVVDEEEEDVEVEVVPGPRNAPFPKLSAQLPIGRNAESDDDDDDNDPEADEERIRSFEHERGNWATHVFIPVNAALMDDIQDQCKAALKAIVPMKASTEFHISLSKTVILQHHFIASFVRSLQLAFAACHSFSVCLHNFKIYANEKKTRTFVGFQVNELYVESLKKLVSKVDYVMDEFKLPLFYKDPSFHISFLWCVGDQVEKLNANLKHLEKVLESYELADDFTFAIKELYCKSGNKKFTFKLK